jgi:hypothetical protein
MVPQANHSNKQAGKAVDGDAPRSRSASSASTRKRGYQSAESKTESAASTLIDRQQLSRQPAGALYPFSP